MMVAVRWVMDALYLSIYLYLQPVFFVGECPDAVIITEEYVHGGGRQVGHGRLSISPSISNLLILSASVLMPSL